MTKQAREVLDNCDFPESCIRELERVLCQHTPAQVISLVWSKDPEGKHDLEWFKPFFNGYVRKVTGVTVEPDDAFWEAYGQFEELSTFDFPSLFEMSRDLCRLRRALGKSRIRKIPYVFKVYLGVEPTRTVRATKVDFEVGNSGLVETRTI